MHHLQNADSRIVLVEAGLVEGLAFVTKRAVHFDQHFTVFSRAGILHPDPARKVLRNVGPAVDVVAEFEQGDLERFGVAGEKIMAGETEAQVVSLALVRHRLRIAEERRDEPGAERAEWASRRDACST